MDDFATAEIQTAETTIFLRWRGAGPPVLLLHGFPQTHAMWRNVVPLLARRYTVVCADLRGMGRAAVRPPPRTMHHIQSAPWRKTWWPSWDNLDFFASRLPAMTAAVALPIARLFDYPNRVDRLALLDIVPMETVWERADARFALGFWPWSLLAQPDPLPERILAAAADAIVDDALGSWGSPASVFPPEIRQAYIHALQDPGHAHAICEGVSSRGGHRPRPRSGGPPKWASDTLPASNHLECHRSTGELVCRRVWTNRPLAKLGSQCARALAERRPFFPGRAPGTNRASAPWFFPGVVP